ncbi:MAG TPA: SET domain-containing protein-lysine N-methyltransferase [Saprospiraceae bacterium]|nr:SET domain-containing protein-lysine N-methyltransferase [Saprospiraceae bacterium]
MEYETPDTNYKIHAEDLAIILSKIGIKDKKTFAKLFTALRKYEDNSILKKIEKGVDDNPTVEKIKTKIVEALFFIPSKKSKRKGTYQYLRIKLAQSHIKAAGTGAYAVDPIPKGARAPYKGVAKNERDTNPYYSWTVKTFDKNTGETDEEDEPIYYIDAYDTDVSNWTRYVNCGMKDKHNNLESEQIYDKFFYVTLKNIEPGEELFIDYGPYYRKENLGMKGKY